MVSQELLTVKKSYYLVTIVVNVAYKNIIKDRFHNSFVIIKYSRDDNNTALLVQNKTAIIAFGSV